jgi:hypothetical protein
VLTRIKKKLPLRIRKLSQLVKQCEVIFVFGARNKVHHHQVSERHLARAIGPDPRCMDYIEQLVLTRDDHLSWSISRPSLNDVNNPLPLQHRRSIGSSLERAQAGSL